MPKERKKLPPIHPGEILKEEFLEPLGLSSNQLALELRVPANRVAAIVNAERGITADTALRLARYFGTTAQFWMNMQSLHDLQVAEDEIGAEVEKRVLPRSVPA